MAGPQQYRPNAAIQPGYINNGGFDSHLRRPALEHQQLIGAKIRKLGTHMGGMRGRHLSELVCRWARNTALPRRLEARKFTQQCLGHRMRRATQTHAVLPPADSGRDMVCARKNQRQRPRPEGLDQGARLGRYGRGPIGKVRFRRNMHNDGMI
jgi:hypothetical protein